MYREEDMIEKQIKKHSKAASLASIPLANSIKKQEHLKNKIKESSRTDKRRIQQRASKEDSSRLNYKKPIRKSHISAATPKSLLGTFTPNNYKNSIAQSYSNLKSFSQFSSHQHQR
jgi:hypothetical protein